MPLQVFADEGDDGGETDTEIRVEASLCFTPSAKYYKEVPIVKNESCAPLLYVVSTNPMMPANELIVELYEENGGQEKKSGKWKMWKFLQKGIFHSTGLPKEAVM